MLSEPIPLTVVGGYLGAGKTTLLNHLLRHPGGRRLGVIVNDFGSLAIDAALLADAADPAAGAGVISLPNGCVCCTVGAGLHEALDVLAAGPSPPDHVVIEVSGVADPSVAAAWGTVPPFRPGGVIVLADATTIIERSRDRYVGDEVLRQLRGADLVIVTKPDLCDGDGLVATEGWLAEVTGAVPSIRVVAGRVPSDVVLGVRSNRPPGDPGSSAHDERYVSWSWTSSGPVSRRVFDRLVDSLGPDVLRLKGRVQLDDGTWVVVQVVGRRVEITPSEPADRSELVAIALRTDPDRPNPFVLHFG